MLNQLFHHEQPPLSVQSVVICCFVTSDVSVILVKIHVLLKVIVVGTYCDLSREIVVGTYCNLPQEIVVGTYCNLPQEIVVGT